LHTYSGSYGYRKEQTYPRKRRQKETIDCSNIRDIINTNIVNKMLSYPQGSPEFSGIQNIIFELLSHGQHTTDCIFGQNSKSSYRKIHDFLVGLLDEAENYLNVAGFSGGESLALSLGQARVLIDYQISRGVLKRSNYCQDCSIEQILSSIVTELSGILFDAKRTLREKRLAVENARLLINTIATLAEKLKK